MNGDLRARTAWKALLGAALLSLIVVTESCSKTSGKQVDNVAARPIAVRMIPVEQKQLRRNVESVGSLFPLDEVTVTPRSRAASNKSSSMSAIMFRRVRRS